MKRFAMALIATSMLLTVVGVGLAKDLSTVGIEEAFIDAVERRAVKNPGRLLEVQASILQGRGPLRGVVGDPHEFM